MRPKTFPLSSEKKFLVRYETKPTTAPLRASVRIEFQSAVAKSKPGVCIIAETGKTAPDKTAITNALETSLTSIENNFVFIFYFTSCSALQVQHLG